VIRHPGRLKGDAFAPSILLTASRAKSASRRRASSLLRRLVEWRAGARWYLFAFGYMAAIKLAAAVIHRALLGATLLSVVAGAKAARSSAGAVTRCRASQRASASPARA